MTNIVPHQYKISKEKRNLLNNHGSGLIWFTGLSGSGKSTIANALEMKLFDEGVRTYTLDGDNIRKGINKDLGFAPTDRSENNRRIAEIAKLMIEAGILVLAAFVSPYRKDRESIRQIVGDDNYIEVFVNASVDECEKRDVKGLYKKARSGEIKNFTGIDAPYEHPLNPDIEINTEQLSVDESVSKIMKLILNRIKA